MPPPSSRREVPIPLLDRAALRLSALCLFPVALVFPLVADAAEPAPSGQTADARADGVLRGWTPVVRERGSRVTLWRGRHRGPVAGLRLTTGPRATGLAAIARQVAPRRLVVGRGVLRLQRVGVRRGDTRALVTIGSGTAAVQGGLARTRRGTLRWAVWATDSDGRRRSIAVAGRAPRRGAWHRVGVRTTWVRGTVRATLRVDGATVARTRPVPVGTVGPSRVIIGLGRPARPSSRAVVHLRSWAFRAWGPQVAAKGATPPPGTTPRGESFTATAEPRLVADPAVVWMATFESPDWKRYWGADQDAFAEKTRVHQPAVSATGNVFDVTLGGSTRDPDKYGMAIRGNFAKMGIGAMDEAHLRYRIFIPADFDFSGGGKLPGLSGFEDGASPMAVSGGGEFNPGTWSGRLYFTGDGGLVSYLYVQHAAGRTISSSSGRYVGISARAFTTPQQNAYKSGGTFFTFRTGVWSTIEVRYRMNTPGQDDGVYQAWVDGRLVTDLSDVQYRQQGHPGLRINQLFATTFYGGPAWSTRQNHLYFDDVVISRAYIGPRTD